MVSLGNVIFQEQHPLTRNTEEGKKNHSGSKLNKIKRSVCPSFLDSQVLDRTLHDFTLPRANIWSAST
jgi:hypothetical protein